MIQHYQFQKFCRGVGGGGGGGGNYLPSMIFFSLQKSIQNYFWVELI